MTTVTVNQQVHHQATHAISREAVVNLLVTVIFLVALMLLANNGPNEVPRSDEACNKLFHRPDDNTKWVYCELSDSCLRAYQYFQFCANRTPSNPCFEDLDEERVAEFEDHGINFGKTEEELKALVGTPCNKSQTTQNGYTDTGELVAIIHKNVCLPASTRESFCEKETARKYFKGIEAIMNAAGGVRNMDYVETVIDSDTALPWTAPPSTPPAKNTHPVVVPVFDKDKASQDGLSNQDDGNDEVEATYESDEREKAPMGLFVEVAKGLVAKYSGGFPEQKGNV
eukprot:Nk52_evm2s2568 gene=Nk52_evmTU2s2568